MRVRIWQGIWLALWLGFITILILPNSYFNEASLKAQYLSYVRALYIPTMMGVLYLTSLDVKRARRLKQKLKRYVPNALKAEYDMVPITVFLNIRSKDLTMFYEHEEHIGNISVVDYFGLHKHIGV